MWRYARFRFLRARVERQYGARLYACALGDSRTRALFERGFVADTSDGRLDCLTLHLYLYTERFQARFTRVVRAMMETFVRDLDRSLREMGTGDLSVGKKVKKILSRVYGAFDAYRLARSRQEWHAALQRNMLGANCFELLSHARKVEERLVHSSLCACVGRAQEKKKVREKAQEKKKEKVKAKA